MPATTSQKHSPPPLLYATLAAKVSSSVAYCFAGTERTAPRCANGQHTRCAFVGCAGHHCLQSQGPSHSTNLEQLGSAATSKHAPSKSSTQKPGQLTRVSRQCEKHNGALPLPSTLVSSACRTVQAGNAEAHCKDMYARKHLPYSMSEHTCTISPSDATCPPRKKVAREPRTG